MIYRSRSRVRLRLRRHRAAHLIAAGVTLLGFVLFLRAVESPDLLRRVPGWFAPTAAAIVWVIVFRLGVRNDRLWRRALRDELLRHDIRPAVCFGCGYDLRHADAGVCPECGERIGTKRSMFERDGTPGMPDSASRPRSRLQREPGGAGMTRLGGVYNVAGGNMSVKDAIQRAIQFATEIYGATPEGLRLEEVVSDDNHWDITLGFDKPDPSPLRRAIGVPDREYKIFRVRKSDGSVESMKMRMVG